MIFYNNQYHVSYGIIPGPECAQKAGRSFIIKNITNIISFGMNFLIKIKIKIYNFQKYNYKFLFQVGSIFKNSISYQKYITR